MAVLKVCKVTLPGLNHLLVSAWTSVLFSVSVSSSNNLPGPRQGACAGVCVCLVVYGVCGCVLVLKSKSIDNVCFTRTLQSVMQIHFLYRRFFLVLFLVTFLKMCIYHGIGVQSIINQTKKDILKINDQFVPYKKLMRPSESCLVTQTTPCQWNVIFGAARYFLANYSFLQQSYSSQFLLARRALLFGLFCGTTVN